VRDSAGIATLVKIGSCIRKLIVGTDKRSQRQEGDCISLLFPFRKESRLIEEFYTELFSSCRNIS
jgi:hypothetical protein